MDLLNSELVGRDKLRHHLLESSNSFIGVRD